MATETQIAEQPQDASAAANDAGFQEPLSTHLANAPGLTRKGLTRLLILMCVVPIATVLILHWSMPAVKPDYLQADCSFVNVPPPTYYEETLLEDRIEFPNAELVIKNTGAESWTHLNIRINSGHYQIYEHGSPLEPGEERRYLLNRFVHRSGAVYQVGINRPNSIEIYARLPDKSRGTYEMEFE